jgi:hypothetical protein
MPVTKAKPKVGTALPDTSQPDPDSDFTDDSGFTSTLSPPGPSGPSFGMGGDVTNPSDFAQEVARATDVPSKGGPAVEDLYASSGKGPVGKLKRPQDTGSTTKAPETKIEPAAPENLEGGGVPSGQPIPMGPPTGAPALGPPSSRPAPAAAAPSPSPAAPAQPQTDDAGAQLPPNYLKNEARIDRFAKQYQSGPQDYSMLDPYVANDANFAGLTNGIPIFLGPDNRVYMRDETGPGKEVRHFADALPGSPEAKNGVPVVDEQAGQVARDAQKRMLALLQTQDAMDGWRKQLHDYQGANQDLTPIQRAELEEVQSNASDWTGRLVKTGAQMLEGPLHITQPMKDLDAARARLATAYTQAVTNNIPNSDAIKNTLYLPNTSDDFATQVGKVNALQAQMESEARALQVMYPYGNKDLEALLKRMGRQGGATQPGPQQNAPAGSTVRPAATPGASPSASKATYDEARNAPVVRTQEDVKKYPSGTLVRDNSDGKLKRIP